MKLSKFVGIAGAAVGLLGGISLTACLILADSGVINFLSENIRSYCANFYDEDGVLLESITRKRGEAINGPSAPEKKGDSDGYYYVSIGWDTTGNGLVDIVPTNMYYSFNAKPVYFKYKLPDINLEDFDLEKLLEFLDKYNIDIEELLQYLGLDMMDLLEWLQNMGLDLDDLPKQVEVNSSSAIVSPFFRVQSFGDWNVRKKKWNNADSFSPGSVYSNPSISPLDFSADKIDNSLLANTKIDYTLTYKTKTEPRAAPTYDIRNALLSEATNSDAYYDIQPLENTYSSSGYPLAYNEYIIDILKGTSFSNQELKNCESKYRDYAYEHYLDVPSEYSNILNEFIKSQDFTSYVRDSQDFKIVNNVFTYLKGDFCHYEYEDNITYRTYDKNEDPIKTFYETRKGSAKHLANFATLAFRKLGLPARYVEGFFDYLNFGNTTAELGYINEWGWVEVYFDGIGWIGIDCNYFSSTATTSTKGGDVSSEVSKKGPGKSGTGTANGEKGNIASFTSSDYTGTIYFKSASYDSYLLGKWSNTNSYVEDKTASINPVSFTYNSCGDNFNDVHFEVTYEKNANYGVAPEYSDIKPTGNDYINAGAVDNGAKKSFNAKILKTEENSIYAVMNSLTGTAKTEEETYYNKITSGGWYQDLDSSTSSLTLGSSFTSYSALIGSYLMTTNIPATCATMNQIQAMLYVKEYLQSHFVYDLDFDYGDVIDPLIGFISSGRGICNNFATLATLIYRYLGFNARYVVGYLTNSVAGKKCYIGANTGHAWTEVYINGVGWVSIDCTGFEEGFGDRDSTKSEDVKDTSYGEGAGGGGLVESKNTKGLNFMLLRQKVDYNGRALKPSDIDVDNFFKIVSKDAEQISQTDFNKKYRVNILSVSADEEGMIEFTPFNKDEYDSKAYVTYSIIDTDTLKNVTYMFTNVKTGQALASKGGYATARVSIDYQSVDLLVKTNDIEITQEDLDSYLNKKTPISIISEGLVNDNFDMYEYDHITYEEPKLVTEDESSHFEFNVKVIHRIRKDSDEFGSYSYEDIDVTNFYNIEYEWGEVTIVES